MPPPDDHHQPPVRSTDVADRTLVIGDSHGSIPMIREALRLAQQLRADRVVSVGDFGIWPGGSGRQFADAADRMAAQRDQVLVVVPGNHDDYDQIEQMQPATVQQLAAAGLDPGHAEVLAGLLPARDRLLVAARGHTLRLGRFTWMLCGGAASIDGPGGIWTQNRGPLDDDAWMPSSSGPMQLVRAGTDLGGWWSAELITAEDVAACAAAGPADVLVTHEAPAEVALTGQHKPVEPGEWPAGEAQRALVSDIRATAAPALQVCGHWHQYAVHRDHLGAVVVLSADVEPAQPQWLVVDDHAGHDRPLVRVAARWDQACALTRRAPRGFSHLARRHQVVHLDESQLVEVTSHD